MPLENSGKHIIKNIRFLKKSVKVSFVDGEKISISKLDYPNYFLYINKEVDEKDYKLLKKSKDVEKLYTYAYKLLTKHPYSEFKIREKLYKKEDVKKSDVDIVIKKLKDNRLLNDDTLLKEYVSYYDDLKYGKNLIVTKLLEKGIFMEKIEDISFPYNKEVEKARYWVNKLNNKYKNKNNLAKRNAIKSYLANKGFDSGVISATNTDISLNDNGDEFLLCQKDYLKVKTRLSKKYKDKELNNKIIIALSNKGYQIKDILKLTGGN